MSGPVPLRDPQGVPLGAPVPVALRITLRRLGPDRGEQVLELAPGAQVRDALRAAGIAAETVLVAREATRTILPDDEVLAAGDVLLVTRVVTGG